MEQFDPDHSTQSFLGQLTKNGRKLVVDKHLSFIFSGNRCIDLGTDLYLKAQCLTRSSCLFHRPLPCLSPSLSLQAVTLLVTGWRGCRRFQEGLIIF